MSLFFGILQRNPLILKIRDPDSDLFSPKIVPLHFAKFSAQVVKLVDTPS